MKIDNLVKCGYGLLLAGSVTYLVHNNFGFKKQEAKQNKQEYRLKTPEELQRIVPDVRVPDTAKTAIDTIYNVPMDCYIPYGKTIGYTKDAKGTVTQIIRVARSFK